MDPTHLQPGDPGCERARMRRFVGVSLGGGRGKTTAIARFEYEGDGRLVLAEARSRWGQRGGGLVEDAEGSEHAEAPFRDDVLVEWLGRWVDERTVVAFDAPLTLPPCVRCTLACPGIASCEVPVVAWMREHGERLVIRRGRSDPRKPALTPYTQRATELLLERATLQPRETLGQGMGPLAARAAYLRRALSPALRLHENLIEVHPRATLIRLFGDRRERRTRHGSAAQTWEVRKELLGELAEGMAFDRVWPDLVVRKVHVFHAVVSAFSAYCWAKERWRGPEDLLASPAVSQPPDSRENEHGDPELLRAAVDALGEMWLEDGWIWTPPRHPRGPETQL
ncbi:DUF429 domain-containing protein [Pseudenhygromyxa sp. WMMC2535]|uniref:DUF429 domain-containing protein n=1 Tax=Pseudenhygromyxa sp. WMMC2535 TaxID=2712867 RepID=UPI001554ADE8|nr:DUF429 domain-containing protein [Pseudenhygromyxa sp. WMMC2535]NVB39733.1 DUF429 domain-containing protein [Pseudenhygromyxa sp. WMMC2535]